MQNPKRSIKTFQERTNLPNSYQNDSAPTKKPTRNVNKNSNLFRLINYYNHFDARHEDVDVDQQEQPHQLPLPPTSDKDIDPTPMVVLLNDPEATASSNVETFPQIQLLQAAINLLKAHAEDAGSSIEKLRVLMADRDTTEPSAYRDLQRQRFLEERRELDAHRTLWSTTQKVSAILRGDESFFEHQRLSDRSLGLVNDAPGYYHQPGEGGELLSCRVRSHRRLVPLALAPKADYRKKFRHHASKLQPPLPPSPFTATSPAHFKPLPPLPLSGSLRGRSGGTVMVYQSKSSPAEDGHRKLVEQRIRDVEITIPDYVGDLLSEFDAQPNGPLLLPLSSPEKKKRKGSLPKPKTPKKQQRQNWTRSISPPPQLTFRESVDGEGWVQVAATDPPGPPQPRVVKKMSSQKRFSALFSSKAKPGAPSPSSSPIDFGLTLPADMTNGSFMSPFSPPLSAYSGRPLRSSNSMSTLPEEALAGANNLKRFSAMSASSLVSPERPTMDDKGGGMTSRLKKRISMLRG